MKIGTCVLRLALTLGSLIVGANGIAAQDQTVSTKEDSAYDPLELLARFLDTVYPDLAQHQGLATDRLSFGDGVFHLGGVDTLAGRAVPSATVEQGAMPVPAPLSTNAIIVFIGACRIGPPFKLLWNINEQTTGKALIFPSVSQEVYRGHAVTAWANILDELVNGGKTVGDAVKDTDAYLLTLTDVNGKKVTEQWQVIGDSSVKFKK